MLKDDQGKLLELLEQLELDVSNIYKLFAKKFPRLQSFWRNMSDEEAKHSDYVRKIHTYALEGKVNFNEKMTNPLAIKSVLENIATIHEKTENNQYSIINALAFSLSMEQSVIEHKFYSFFNSDNPEIMKMLKAIQGETIIHESKVKKALEEEKNRK